MNPPTSLQLAELLTSRLCHDIITPIGAIQTGLELLSETPPSHHTESKEILNLILHSAQTASALASFFRAAFGRSGNSLTQTEIKAIIENYFIHSKLRFQWQDSIETVALKGWGRLFLNSVLWISECAPRGGDLHVSSLPNASGLTFLLKAEPLILHEGILDVLEGTSTGQELTPRIAPCYLIRHFIDENNGTLTVHQTSSPATLTLTFKAYQ